MSDAPLMLSVSGMRGWIGASLTPPRVSLYAAAFGQWVASHRRPGADTSTPPTVVIGRDSRPSGEMVEAAAVSGLLATGCKVVRVGVLSTPGIAVMLQALGADGGMVLTASHNPSMWNGVKALRYDGVAPPKDQAQAIIDAYQDAAVSYVPVEQIQDSETNDAGVKTHVDAVVELVDVDTIRAAKLKVVVDSVHGAGGDEARELLAALGVENVHMYAEPTGEFPHIPEPTEANLTELCAKVKEHGADAGFAQDPDADRLAIVDEQGGYIGEEYTLALCAKHLLKQGDAVAANLSTSRMIDDLAAGVGGRVLRTPVGEANVASAMREHDALVGGEGNGGIIHRTVSQVRDSLIGMAFVIEMLAQRKVALSAIVAEIPSYAIVKDKVDVAGLEGLDIHAKLGNAFDGAAVDTQDGVRIDWPDEGCWVHVRPSNTEPILRLIAEATTEAKAKDVIAEVSAKLGIG